MGRAVLYEDDHIRLVASGQAGPVLVTMNDIGTVATGDGFWADRFAERRGAVLGVVCKDGSQYPRHSMAVAVPICREVIGERPAYGYGWSQGGYGVLKYGAALGLRASLAFSPVTSVDPSDADHPREFAYLFDPLKHIGMRVRRSDLPNRARAFFGQDTTDERRSERAFAQMGVRTHLIDGGHHAFVEVVRARRIGPMIDALVAGGCVATALTAS